MFAVNQITGRAKCIACQLEKKGEIIFVDSHYSTSNQYPLCEQCYDIIYGLQGGLQSSKRELELTYQTKKEKYDYGSLYRTSIGADKELSQFKKIDEKVRDKFLGR